MTAPPLPASPCLRVRLGYTQTDSVLGGSRFYLSYSGASPNAGNCITLADDISSAWGSNLATLVHSSWALTEVDVLDIASTTGASGQWNGSIAGTEGSAYVPASAAQNVEYNIARRYRGGKPRMFLPPAGQATMADPSHWNATQINDVNTNIAAFFAAIHALAIGSLGTLQHVNLSYYEGFTNHTNTSGRERAVPTYRPVALLDTVNGYSAKGLVGSQRRRRAATTF